MVKNVNQSGIASAYVSDSLCMEDKLVISHTSASMVIPFGLCIAVTVEVQTAFIPGKM